MPSGIFTLKQQELALGQGAWTNQKPLAVDYLVVAGGGSGGSGGGGGAGGLLQGNIAVSTGSSITVTVGGGGAGVNSYSAGNAGNNSVFGSITSNGGGAGSNAFSTTNNNGGSGGSGGGAYPGRSANSEPAGVGGQGTSGQGNAGGSSWGDASASSSYLNGAGGGGAGTRGLSGSTGAAGNGGAGVASDISGTRTAYAGGGGGPTYTGSSSTTGLGGAGGGGLGGYTGNNAASGSANTGGGGGGAMGYTSGNGGSGIVILSYPDIYQAAASTTGSPTVSTSGSGSFVGYDAGGTGGPSATTYVRFAGTSALAIGTTGTYEFWIYPTRYSTNHFVISQGVNSGVDIYYDASGNVIAGNTSSGAQAGVSGASLSLNTWSHVAVVFNSGTVSIYINGVSRTLTGTTTGYNMTSTGTVSISGYQPIVGQYGIIGYLSNVRIVKGVAVYTGNFTPSTAPLQATQPAGTNIAAITGTQTSLLLNTVSGSFLSDSSTNGYVLSSASTGTAAPTWNQLSPFATGLGYKNRVYTWTSSGSITF